MKQKRINFNIDEDKHRLLKEKCANQGITIKDLLLKYINKYLEKENQMKK